MAIYSFFFFLIIYLFIETYLYRVDNISSQASFHMCPVVICYMDGIMHKWSNPHWKNSENILSLIATTWSIYEFHIQG